MAGTTWIGADGAPAQRLRSRIIVLPFPPQEGQQFDGVGMAVHFLLGNALAVHTGLEEFWFGWRAKKLFPTKEALTASCRAQGVSLDIAGLALDHDVRYWLEGNVERQGDGLNVHLRLTDAEGARREWGNTLVLDPADHFVAFRSQFFEWLAAYGLRVPETQIQKTLWVERTGLNGMERLGRALEVFYLNDYEVDPSHVDLSEFESSIAEAPHSYLALDLRGWALYRRGDYAAARASFLSALRWNPDGLGAVSGLIWCAILSRDEPEAYSWAETKASLRGEKPEHHRAIVTRRLSKAEGPSGA